MMFKRVERPDLNSCSATDFPCDLMQVTQGKIFMGIWTSDPRGFSLSNFANPAIELYSLVFHLQNVDSGTSPLTFYQQKLLGGILC